MAKIVRQCMEEASNLDIPLPVSVRVGERLGSLQPYTPEQVCAPLHFFYCPPISAPVVGCTCALGADIEQNFHPSC